MRTLKFTIFPFLFVLLLPGIIGSAQDEIPVFRSGVQLVELAVAVRDSSGKPVPGLTAADFILLENGTERKIDVFVEPITPESRAAAESTLPPGVYSNAPELNRNSRGIVMVLVDSLNTCVTDQMLAKQQIIDFLLDLPPNQRIALYSIGMQFRVLHDFTSEPEPLIERLKEMPLPTSENALFQAGDLTGTIIRDGRIDTFAQARDFEKALWSWFEDRRTLNDFALYDQRVRNSIAAIEGIARNVEGLPGKKTLLWLSGGFQELVGQLDPSARPGPRPGMPPPELAREQFNTAEAFQKALAAANRAGLTIYAIDSRGLTPGADLSPSACDGIHAGVTLLNQQVLKDAAAATGGQAILNTNDIRGALRNALNEIESTYTLGFYAAGSDGGTPERKSRAGGRSNRTAAGSEARRLEVRVRKPGLQVAHRRFYAPRPLEADSSSADRLTEAAKSPVDATGLIFLATVFPDAGPGGAPLLQAVIPVSQLRFEENNGQHQTVVRLVTVPRMADGRTLPGNSQTIRATLTPEQMEQARQTGLIIRHPVQFPKDTASLRVVIAEFANGSTGSLTIPIRASRQP